MKQTKYKIGEMLKDINGSVFKVDSIRVNRHDPRLLVYNDIYDESDCELYQEPQKKKLYAFRSKNGGGIHFKEHESLIEETSARGYFINKIHLEERAPEYDIEYPSPE